MERATGMCVLTVKRIPVAGASPEASRLEQVICVMDRRIWSWCGCCTTSGKRQEAFSGLCQQEVKPDQGQIPDYQEGMAILGGSVGYQEV